MFDDDYDYDDYDRDDYDYDDDYDRDDYDYDDDDYQYSDKDDEYEEDLEDYDWRDEVEDGLEYDVDPDDYETEDEYLEALDDAKYDWQDDMEDGSKYDVHPEDYESEDEYDEALAEARRYKAEEEIKLQEELERLNRKQKDDDIEKELTEYYIISEIESEERDYALLFQKELDKFKPKGYTTRKKEAKAQLKKKNQSNDPFSARCNFIAENKSLAAKYLTVNGDYLYAQAIEDHFNISIELEEDDEKSEIEFYILLQHLVDTDVTQAIKIWGWCLETFMPFIQYAESTTALTHDVLYNLDCFPEEFIENIVDHMIHNTSFIENLILKSTDVLYYIDDFVSIALQKDRTEIAKRITECAFDNPHTTVEAKIDFIKSCIDQFYDMEDPCKMMNFQKHVFPIVYTQTDSRIKSYFYEWDKEISGYLSQMELTHGSLDDLINKKEPCCYYYVIEDDPPIENIKKYKYCDISFSSNPPQMPYYTYFPGKADLHVGDKVIVPFGADNEPKEGVVIKIGECYKHELPCSIGKMKKVIKKIK